MFLCNSENHVHFIELSGRRTENRQGFKCLNPDKNHAPFTHSQKRCHVFHLQIWPPSHVSTNSVSKKLYKQVHFKHAEDSLHCDSVCSVSKCRRCFRGEWGETGPPYKTSVSLKIFSNTESINIQSPGFERNEPNAFRMSKRSSFTVSGTITKG